ncbi:hypothetical protein AAZX31_07G116900 [Glycine max]|uniref:Polygalacturonase n=2 Tax=Glycine subgen. Soja TaxID=1462606 RepID=A0A368UHZ9_SOYBN|nr:probable polygalacturonase At3g15720 [Glycine max]XP_028238562.1 probable polygalacturonase At3g15720 isoform X1 [Glycine soja]KAG5022439.1 hypothetical protein JHK85_018781 [Glycine max]KAG5037535.1 hypothetical protein JHK86_018375 [Glycine max]KAG5142656.1 hypothetical protein JHK82_018351 [Glycine max]KAH1086556.1 hypothetical protein GYH30_018191 [Glycine max]KAH1241720.1 putative polygalacturonase [Glycine max]|eukprot:XP_006583489.1 probable polygalacturonase At3g15720 isoform X1 [Glycine max]
MQSLDTCVFILAFIISPYLCHSVGTNTIYNVINYGAKGDGRSDDSQAFLRAWQSTCGAQGAATLLIPPNRVFLVSSLILKGPCSAAIQIQLRGKIVAPAKDAWVGGYKYTWILISNINGLTIEGNGGLLDGDGSTWWACKNCPRPAVLSFQSCNRLSVSYLNIINSPRAHIGINQCQGAIFSNINIHAPGNSPNTDGIDINSSQNIMIRDSFIASGDDCIAITGSSSYINVTGIDCGPGHGISIGSLGRNYDTIQEVHVQNCKFTSTTNGARIKTFAGGSGYAKRITFEEITLIQARNPIIIDQFYVGEDDLTNGEVQVSDVTFRGFRGTCTYDQAIDLSCGPLGCFNIILDQNNIVSSQPGKQAYCSCKNAHGSVRSSVPNCPCLVP